MWIGDKGVYSGGGFWKAVNLLATEANFCRLHKQKDTFCSKTKLGFGVQAYWPHTQMTGTVQDNSSNTKSWCINITAVYVSLYVPLPLHVTSCMNNDKKHEKREIHAHLGSHKSLSGSNLSLYSRNSAPDWLRACVKHSWNPQRAPLQVFCIKE